MPRRITLDSMRTISLAIVIGLATVVSAADTLRVGVFEVDVSPPVGSPLAYDPCRGVAMPLQAKGMVLLGADRPVVLCAVDWIGIANAAHGEWCRAIAEAADTAVDRVSVHTLHQHDAPFCDFSAEAILAARGRPGTLFDIKFAQRCIEDVAAAVKHAITEAQPVSHVGVGQATVEKVASNRRILGLNGKVRATRYTACRDLSVRMEPEGVIDPRLKSVSFWNEETPVLVMTYYATHPQSYYRQGIANPDFPGMARFLRQVTLNGLPHVHFNGAGGNIGAGKYNDGSADNRQTLAIRVAQGMETAWKNTQRIPVSAKDMAWSSQRVAIPPAPHLNETKLLEVIDNQASTEVDRKSAATDLAWLRRCQNGDTLQVSCLRLGPANIVHMPGEAVVEYQLHAQQLDPDRFVAVAAYGDYGTGYICLEQHYEEGGYEASQRASRVAPNTEPTLKQAIRDALEAAAP